MDKVHFRGIFEDVLRQCQDVMKSYDVSDETLNHIQRVEESLRKIMDERN